MYEVEEDRPAWKVYGLLHLYLARGDRPLLARLRARGLWRAPSAADWPSRRPRYVFADGLEHRAVARCRLHRPLRVRPHLLLRPGRQAEVSLDQPGCRTRLRVLAEFSLLFSLYVSNFGFLQRDLRFAGGRDHPDALRLLLGPDHAHRRGDEPGDRMAHPRRQERGREGPGRRPQTRRPPADEGSGTTTTRRATGARPGR